MLRISLALALCLPLATLAGCLQNETGPVAASSQSDEAPVELTPVAQQPAQPAAPNADAQRRIRSPLLRKLLEALDELDDEGTDEERNLIRDILRDADVELSRSLGDSSRQKILKANKKLPAFKVRANPRPRLKEIEPPAAEPPAAEPPAAEPQPSVPPNPSSSDKGSS